jgi:hypothetical protein
MTTTCSRTSGGVFSIRFRPSLVVRRIGLALLCGGLYFLWQIATWLVDVLRSGRGGVGVGVGEVVFLPIAIVVSAAIGVPGAMMAFFGATARVEPVPRRVFVREGFMGFGAERAIDIVEGAKVSVRLHVGQRTSSATSTSANDSRVVSCKVAVESPAGEPVEIGQVSQRRGERARELAAAAAQVLAIPVVDRARRSEARVPEQDRITSAFLERHGIDAAPRGFRVRAIRVVSQIVEALLS